MNERYEPEQMTYAFLCALRLADGRIVAGIRLSHRHTTEDGLKIHVPYAVLSLHYGVDELKTPSMRQAIPVFVSEILREIDPSTRLLVVKGSLRHFIKEHEVEAKLAVLSSRVKIRVIYKNGLERRVSEIMDLANDAIRRGRSVTCAL